MIKQQKYHTKNLIVNFRGIYISLLILPFLFSFSGNTNYEDPGNQNVFNVLDYGAVGNGITLDSPSIQKTIDAASLSGKNAMVLIPGPHKYQVGTLYLKSNINFHLEKNAELIASTSPDDYTDRAIIRAQKVKNLTISGEGNVYDVVFRDINFVSRYHSDPWWGRGEAISLTAIPRNSGSVTGKIHDIELSNITGKSENSIRINGTPESIIQNVKMKNVEVYFNRWTHYKGGLFDNRPTNVYPEIEVHGNPGFSIRYAENVELLNCSVKWGENAGKNFTHALEAYETKNLTYTGFKGEAADPKIYTSIMIK